MYVSCVRLPVDEVQLNEVRLVVLLLQLLIINVSSESLNGAVSFMWLRESECNYCVNIYTMVSAQV